MPLSTRYARRRRELCATLGLAPLLVAAGGCHRQGAPAAHTILRRGLTGEPSTLDPAKAADSFSFDVIADLYEGLTRESPSGEIIPGVADSWTVDSSGREYRFVLRPDACWSNGEPVRASHFVVAWQRVVDPTQGSPVADNLRLVSHAAEILSGKAPVSQLGVRAPSDRVLVVTLEEPAPYFPQMLTHSATFPIFSEASARSHDAKTWISNGAYVLRGWSPGTGVTLTRNLRYWSRSTVQIPQIRYVVVPDAISQYTRYRAGEIDVTDSVPTNAAVELRRERPAELVVTPYLATAYYGLNLAASPFTGNPALRKAVSLAIDRPQLVKTLAFGQTPAVSFVPPGTSNYQVQSDWAGRPENDRVGAARHLYEKAGYSATKPLRLRVLYNANPAIKDTAVVIASMWKDTLGIETEFIEEEYRVFLQSRHDRSRWDVARLAWTADFNDASNFLDTLRSQSPNNDPGYVNPHYDELLDTAEQTADADRRRELLEEAERRMLADMPIVPLYHFVSKRLIKPFVEGFQANALNHLRSQSLSLKRTV